MHNISNELVIRFGKIRGCPKIIFTRLNIKIDIAQKVYEWPGWYFGKKTAWSLILLELCLVNIILGHPLGSDICNSAVTLSLSWLIGHNSITNLNRLQQPRIFLRTQTKYGLWKPYARKVCCRCHKNVQSFHEQIDDELGVYADVKI